MEYTDGSTLDRLIPRPGMRIADVAETRADWRKEIVLGIWLQRAKAFALNGGLWFTILALIAVLTWTRVLPAPVGEESRPGPDDFWILLAMGIIGVIGGCIAFAWNWRKQPTLFNGAGVAAYVCLASVLLLGYILLASALGWYGW